MDMWTAFLQGELNDEIYIKQPDVCINSDGLGHVCKLNNSLISVYGLKQAAGCWSLAVDSCYQVDAENPAQIQYLLKSVNQKNGKIEFLMLAL